MADDAECHLPSHSFLCAILFLLAGGALGGEALGSLVKPNGSPPLDMPNTLALETRPAAALSQRSETSSKPIASGRCAASAVHLAHSGVRIVTARHCATDVLAVFDETHHVVPVGQSLVGENIDLALLDVQGPLPWSGLEPRRSSTLQLGERLCAWRFERGIGGVERQRICGKLVRRVERAGAAPLIELSHPYPPGTSGSALVDRDGRIAGVVVASTADSGIAEPIDAILTWDEANSSVSRLARTSLRRPTATPKP